MTITRSVEVTCWRCGARAAQRIVESTSVGGPPDLDLRAASPARESIGAWLQSCSTCAYVAPSLDGMPELPEAVARGMASTAWATAPDGLPGVFLRRAAILQEAGEAGEAGAETLHAAWAADDLGDDGTARRCRIAAASLMLQGLAAGDLDAAGQRTVRVRAVDILRRAHRWEEARELGTTILAESPDDFLADVVRFELRRIRSRDAGAHRMDEVKATAR